jgi:hypothetical protein
LVVFSSTGAPLNLSDSLDSGSRFLLFDIAKESGRVFVVPVLWSVERRRGESESVKRFKMSEAVPHNGSTGVFQTSVSSFVPFAMGVKKRRKR